MTFRPLIVFVVVLVVAGAAASAGLAAASSVGDGVFQADDEEIDPDDIVLRFDLQTDGTAVVSVEHRYRLADAEMEEAFEELRADIEADPDAFTGRFAERMAGTVESAEAATDREMSVGEVTISAEVRSLPQEYGVVRYEFEWHGFAVGDGQRIIAGDALAGLFLDEDTRLVIAWAGEYRLEDASPEPDDVRSQTVVWRGPLEFGPEGPRVTVSTAAGADNDTGVGEPGNGPPLWLNPTALSAVALAVLFVIVGGAWWFGVREKRPLDTPLIGGSDDTEHEIDRELLSNEEQVLHVLQQHGGRARQQEVVQELGWTDAKTSQIVRNLRDAGEVESFRLGRENVLKLPDDDENSF